MDLDVRTKFEVIVTTNLKIKNICIEEFERNVCLSIESECEEK